VADVDRLVHVLDEVGQEPERLPARLAWGVAVGEYPPEVVDLPDHAPLLGTEPLGVSRLGDRHVDVVPGRALRPVAADLIGPGGRVGE
jgi:hypothetical protein